jgi:hypothetical protein
MYENVKLSKVSICCPKNNMRDYSFTCYALGSSKTPYLLLTLQIVSLCFGLHFPVLTSPPLFFAYIEFA